MISVPHGALTGLPDPITDPQFYEGVPARRLIAFLLDAAALCCILGALVLVALLLGLATFGLGTLAMLPVIASVTVLYRWLSLAEWSATPGMRLVGVEIRRGDGARLDGLTALLHTLAFHLCLIFAGLMVIGLIVLAATPHRRLLHDLVLGTAMINRPL